VQAVLKRSPRPIDGCRAAVQPWLEGILWGRAVAVVTAEPPVSVTGHPPSGTGAATMAMGKLAQDGLVKYLILLPLAVLLMDRAIEARGDGVTIPPFKSPLLVSDILPILLLGISYMLYRATRYSRILATAYVLRADRLMAAVDIALDDPKLLSATTSYDSVVDASVADLDLWFTNDGRGSRLHRAFRSFVGWFNVAKFASFYLICQALLLLILAKYSVHVFSEFSDDISVGNLVLGMAALFLLLSWLSMWPLAMGMYSIASAAISHAAQVGWVLRAAERLRDLTAYVCDRIQIVIERYKDVKYERLVRQYDARAAEFELEFSDKIAEARRRDGLFEAWVPKLGALLTDAKKNSLFGADGLIYFDVCLERVTHALITAPREALEDIVGICTLMEPAITQYSSADYRARPAREAAARGILEQVKKASWNDPEPDFSARHEIRKAYDVGRVLYLAGFREQRPERWDVTLFGSP